MPVYNYTAIMQDGKEKKGSLEAVSEAAAKEALKAEGMIPLSIVEPNFLNKEVSFNFTPKVKPRELSIFCRQFQSILGAGITVINALQMLSEQSENKTFAEAIRETRIAVEKGETLADAMRLNPRVFPEILVHMVEAGEASGNLEIAFERMGMHFEKESHLKALIAKSMVYPVILILVVIGVVVLMMVKIVPMFVSTFDEVGGQLPGITLAVMAVSDFLVHSWYIPAGILAALIAAVSAVKRTEGGAIFIGRLQLNLPLFGNLTIKSASARLSRTLSTLLSAGISLVDAVEMIGKLMSNRIVQKVMEGAKEEVERGVPLSKPIEASGVFPPMVYHMLEIGEETGNMEAMLDRIADYYDEEVEMATEALTAALEPMIIVVLAAIVVPIILAILMPMLSIYSSIEG